jgi:UDP-N-acetylglucosamine 4,6-dehydratase/5-epimerase
MVQTLLIFGGTGSLGKALIHKYVHKYNIVNFSRDELKQWELQLLVSGLKSNNTFVNVIGNIRNYESVKTCINTYKPNVVIIASALKQIVRCEYQPNQSIKTNVNGPQNVLRALRTHVNVVTCFVSTDKACNPINTYGVCKALSERLMISESKENTQNKYVIVRYGNVLCSRGSIIPLLKSKCLKNEDLTITTKDMTRFIMSLKQCTNLIEYALIYGESGDIIIPILPAMSILTLFKLFAEKYDKKITEIGIRPGEKIHEMLINKYELMRSVSKNHDNIIYNIIKPYYKKVEDNSDKLKIMVNGPVYESDNIVLTRQELLDKLKELDVEL